MSLQATKVTQQKQRSLTVRLVQLCDNELQLLRANTFYCKRHFAVQQAV